MWRFVKYWLLAATLLLAGLPTMAEEPASPPPEPTEATRVKTNSNDNDTTKNSTPSPRTKAPEFDPSEQISEDLSVPFPVDI